MEYLESMGAAEKSSGPPKPSSGSFLRDYWLTPDQDDTNHVIVRTGKGIILLNAYPYANGHLLVALGEPRARILDYDPPDRAALWQLTELAADLMELTLEPQGINIGVNQGRAAGAGVPQHIHVHLVPRWGGDVNFMATVGNVRVIPGSLEAMAKRYREMWKKMTA
jgi:ATP adenylyltransferase